MSKTFLAVVMALMAATAQAESLFQGWEVTELPAVQRQRALLATAGATVYYSPSYSPSPSPSYSPTPSPVASPVASPKASPSPVASPKASPKPTSPRVCKFATTKNANTYKIVIRARGNWGLGALALSNSAARVYRKYSQTKLKVRVTGPAGQKPKKPYQAFVFFVYVPVTRCVGFKEGMRAALSTALRKTKYSKSIKVVSFKKIN